MAEAPDPKTLAIARAAYAQLQEQALQRSPLARIAEWVRAGKAPTAELLRGQGLTTESSGPERLAELRLARTAFVRAWGFSIPCAEAIGTLARLAPLVEIGAGSGYWTALLRNAGLDVVATDATPQGDIGYGFEASRFCEIEALAGPAAVRAYPDRNVFCSWPTQDSPWALAAVRAMALGRRVALIGEPRGGQTGSRGLHRYLDTRFRLLGVQPIPQFPKTRDALYVYERIR
jgi:hypothetical protein